MIKAKVAFLEGRLFSSQSKANLCRTWNSQLEQILVYLFIFWKLFRLLWLAGNKPALEKSHFCFDYVNRLYLKQ